MSVATILTLVSVVGGCCPSIAYAQSEPNRSDLAVDLSEREFRTIDQTQDDPSAIKDWFRRIEVWGFGAVDYLHTGRDGSRPRGALLVSQASLFVEAEVDAEIDCAECASLMMSFGQARINDTDDAFDRDFLWFVVEPLVRVTDCLDAVFRWSEIGTYDSQEGSQFEAKPFGSGSQAFGFESKRVTRGAGGMRWRVQEKVIVKAEVGFDRFWVIDSSSLESGDDRRLFGGLEIVLSF